MNIRHMLWPILATSVLLTACNDDKGNMNNSSSSDGFVSQVQRMIETPSHDGEPEEVDALQPNLDNRATAATLNI